MMIPPLVRIGPPPLTLQHQEEIVALHREFGWLMVKKSMTAGYFYREGPEGRSPVHVTNILCWMPQDGS